MPITPQQQAELLTSLIAGDRAASASCVDRVLSQQVPTRDIYINLFQHSLYEIGRRWEQGEVSVTTEHIATAIVEELLARVYPVSARREPVHRRAVVSCVADEFHQLGGRIVADSLEILGWEVDFVGAGEHIEALLERVGRSPLHLVALSVSVDTHLERLREGVLAVRATNSRVPVIVGGRALQQAGADFVDRLGVTDVSYLPNLTALEALALRLEARDDCR